MLNDPGRKSFLGTSTSITSTSPNKQECKTEKPGTERKLSAIFIPAHLQSPLAGNFFACQNFQSVSENNKYLMHLSY